MIGAARCRGERKARYGCAGRWSSPDTGTIQRRPPRASSPGFGDQAISDRIDGDGYVRVLDRKKDMINRGGLKIYSVEVENALLSHAGVLEAAVIATALSGPRRTSARDRVPQGRWCNDERGPVSALRRAARRLQGARDLQLPKRAVAAQRQRQDHEARTEGCRLTAALIGRSAPGESPKPSQPNAWATVSRKCCLRPLRFEASDVRGPEVDQALRGHSGISREHGPPARPSGPSPPRHHLRAG